MASPKLLTAAGLLLAGVSAQQKFDTAQALTAAYLSAAAYCDATTLTSWTCVPCEANDITNATVMYDAQYDVQGFVALGTDGTIYVSFRGSTSLIDWIDNIDIFPSVIYPGCAACEVHSGFYEDYLSLSTAMGTFIDGYGGRNAPGIVVTGHSLGAAMSALAVYELVLAGYPVTKHYDFGQPRVGNPAFAASFASVVMQHNTSGHRLNDGSTRAANQSVGAWSPILTAAVQRAMEATFTTSSAADTMVAAVKSLRADSNRSRGKHAALKAARGALFDALDFTRATSTAVNATVSFRVTHNADPVPQVPWQWMGYAHPPQEVWYNQAQTSYTLCNATNGEDPTCSDSALDLDVFDHQSYMSIAIDGLC